MAEDKSSFILYTDVITTLDKLSNEQAGILFKTILDYVNDKDPIVNDLIIDLAFDPIKKSLKRDLKKWEDFRKKQSENGKKGGRPHKANESQKTQPFLEETQKSLSVNVSVSDILNTNSIDVRKQKFSDSLNQFIDLYGNQLITDFIDYWTEPNKSNTKFRMESEKTWDTSLRLKRWAKSDFNKPKQTIAKGATDQSNNTKLFD